MFIFCKKVIFTAAITIAIVKPNGGPSDSLYK